LVRWLLLLLLWPVVALADTGGIASIGQPALPPGFAAFPYVNPSAPKGGSVTLAAIGSFDNFNPFILRGTATEAVGQVWDTLLRANADEPASAYGLLAESVVVAPDKKSVTFTLRPEAKFQDGTPVTAEDVKWTFETLLSQARPYYKAYYADVDHVTTQGERAVTFVFKTDQNRELPMILGEMPVLPEHWWKGRDFSTPLTDPPLGSGPYKVGDFAFGRSITLDRVPNYWGANLPTAKGLSNFDHITTEYFRDATVAMEAFKAGQIDYRMENIAKNWATSYDFPAVQKGLVKKEEVAEHLPAGMQGFAMNTRRPIFADPRVRQAMDWAFDFEWMNKALFYGAYTRSNSYFANSDLASSGVPQGGELALLEPFRKDLPPEVFTTPFTLPVTDGSGNNRKELAQALRLLREAGWEVKDRKLVNAQGQPFAFTILLADPTYERVALPYVQNLEKLGMQVSVRTVDPSQYQKLTDDFDYDMTMMLWPESEVPGNEQMDFWSCSAAKSEGSSNVSGVCSPAVDALIQKVITASDRQQLLDATHALDRVLLWGWYVVPNWYLSVDRIAYWDKFARPSQPVRTGVVFNDWWIDPKKDAALTAAKAKGF
jgi:microcin C transport system substrate-binding protein